MAKNIDQQRQIELLQEKRSALISHAVSQGLADLKDHLKDLDAHAHDF
ncbi:MAG: hypothetical protein R6U50_15665 [Desulfobacterales bacterium]